MQRKLDNLEKSFLKRVRVARKGMHTFRNIPHLVELYRKDLEQLKKEAEQTPRLKEFLSQI